MTALMALPASYAGHKVSISVKHRAKGDDLVLFMHGLGCAKEAFDGAFEAEDLQEFSLAAFDFPSHGASDPVHPIGANLDTYADIAKAVADAIPHRRLFFVCHSLGGAAGLIASQSFTDLTCFISVEGNLIGRDCGLVSRQIAAQGVRQFTVSGFAEFVKRLHASADVDERMWGEWVSHCDPAGLHGIARSLVEWSEGGKLLTMFRQLPNRAYVYGACSKLGYLWPSLEGTRLFAVGGSGHFPMLDNPTDFFQILGRVLREARDQSSQALVAPCVKA